MSEATQTFQSYDKSFGNFDRSITIRTSFGILLAFGILAVAPWVLEVATIHSTTDFLIYLTLAMIWNLLAGYGGLFAFTGWFRNKKLGAYRAFVTDLNRCIVIRLPKRTVVVSPNSPERFIEALKPA